MGLSAQAIQCHATPFQKMGNNNFREKWVMVGWTGWLPGFSHANSLHAQC